MSPLSLSWHSRDSLILRHLRTTLRSLIGLFPLTLQGVIVLLAAAAALSIYGYGAMDLVVYALAICALIILVFCLFCAVISGVIVQRRMQRELAGAVGIRPGGIRAEAGYPNESGLQLPALSWLPLIRLNWQWDHPDQVETRIRQSPDHTLIEELIPHRRCLTSRVVRRFIVSDVLGLCRYSFTQSQAIPCRVLPQVNTLQSLPLLRSLTSEDGIPNPGGEPEGDRMEIRRYAPGDSVRNIMWKAYARNRQLNVRLPERSVFHSQRTIAYLLSSSRDEAAAATARVALEHGALGEQWQFGADGTVEACSELEPALAAVARSRALERPHRYGLDDFLTRSNAGAGVHCIVFAAAERAPWLGQLKSSLSALSGQTTLVLATDGLHESTRSPLWQRLLLSPARLRDSSAGPHGREAEGGVEKAELLGLLTELGQFVESIVIIDRRTGLSFDHNLRRI